MGRACMTTTSKKPVCTLSNDLIRNPLFSRLNWWTSTYYISRRKCSSGAFWFCRCFFACHTSSLFFWRLKLGEKWSMSTFTYSIPAPINFIFSTIASWRRTPQNFRITHIAMRPRKECVHRSQHHRSLTSVLLTWTTLLFPFVVCCCFVLRYITICLH